MKGRIKKHNKNKTKKLKRKEVTEIFKNASSEESQSENYLGFSICLLTSF